MRLLGIFCLLYFFLNSVITVQADIIINEVYPNPVTGEAEWIELYNTATESASLAHWQLKDVLTTPATIHQFTATDSIASLSYFIVDLASQKLNNSADGVRLINSNAQEVDGMDYTSSQQGMSWSKLQTLNTWHLTNPTKGSENPLPNPSPSITPSPSSTIIPSPTPLPQQNIDIRLVSFSPCPVTGDLEYIELKNNSNENIHVEDWKILDKDDNYKILSGTLTAKAVTHINWSGSLLNNAGDSFSLFSNDERLLATAEYGECEKGKPYYFVDNSWIQSATSETSVSNSVTFLEKKQGAIDIPDDTNGVLVNDVMASNSGSFLIHPNLQLLAATLSAVLTSFVPSNNIDSNIKTIHQVEISKTGFFNVIIGGFLISISGLLQLYDKLRPIKTEIFT